MIYKKKALKTFANKFENLNLLSSETSIYYSNRTSLLSFRLMWNLSSQIYDGVLVQGVGLNILIYNRKCVHYYLLCL